MKRRTFFSCAGMALAPLAGFSLPQASLASQDSLGVSAAGLIDQNESRAVDFLRCAYGDGIRLFDAAAAYGDGLAERWTGAALRDCRDARLITKTLRRDYDGAKRDLEESLSRLQTDHIHCWMVHDLRNEYESEKIMSSSGAWKAMQEAKEQGVVERIGASSYRPSDALLNFMKRVSFDAAMVSSAPNNALAKQWADIAAAFCHEHGLSCYQVEPGNLYFASKYYASI